MEQDSGDPEPPVVTETRNSNVVPDGLVEEDETRFRGSLKRARNLYGRRGAPPWESTDSLEVRIFWKWLAAEGMRPETIRGWRHKTLRFFSWVHATYGLQPVKTNWKHVMEFKQMLFSSGLKKAGVLGYMDAVRAYFRFKAESTMENYRVS